MDKLHAYNNILDNPVVCYDMFNSFLGDFLGKGYSRYVFNYTIDKKTVVKIDYNSRGSNYMEWEVWNTVKNTKFAKWFAPCIYCSPDGKLLLQRKVDELTSRSLIPKKIPAFFHDVRHDNFGMFQDGKERRMVCFDYALTNLLKKGLTKEMKEINWTIGGSCSLA